MEDIAKAAGVSRGAVSKVLFPNGTSGIRVGEKTAQRIRKVADQMGYLPNLSAKQLAGEKSRLIGVLIDSFGASVYYDIMQQLERHMAQHGYRLIIGQVHDDVGSIAEYLRDFAGRGVEGVVSFVHNYPQFQDEIEKLYHSVHAINNLVCIGDPKIAGRDHINLDTAMGVQLLVRHLHETGRRRIALFLSMPGFASTEARKKGFKSELARVSLDEKQCPIGYFKRSFGVDPAEESIYQGLDDLFRKHPEVDAVIASNDLVALYTIQYLTARGIHVPEQVAVTGFDNTAFSAAATPALTTVDQSTTELARKTAELLFSRTGNPERKAQNLVVLPRLIIRKSSVISSFKPHE